MGAEKRIRLGVSACLLGQRVRYDGQHKLDPFLTETLSRFVDYVPVCPEVECGLSVPREAMRLVGDPASPRLMTRRTGVDMTERMLNWTRDKIAELQKSDLCGFIFKAKSPSSGMERVKVYSAKGDVIGSAPGIFAREFMKAFPLLPVEDEGRLRDPDLRENFIERVFTLQRYREAIGMDSLEVLMRFHARHKYLILSHSETYARAMGRALAASDRKTDLAGLLSGYERLLLESLALRATPAKHTNVLQHMLGFFRDSLTADEKQELLEIFRGFRTGMIPLIVPVTLIKHHVRKYGVDYLKDQAYLDPHPLELKLRNHA
jgi:uncharacterized protein YbgA (DUF1722 family)/uncharacterized protein YbbK (DUF523 family)